MFKNHIEACEEFFKLEKDLNLFDWRIDNIYVWDLIRFSTFNQIMQAKDIYGQAHSQIEPSFLNRVKKFTSSLFNYVCNNPFFIPKDRIIFLGHPRRKFFPDGKYWDIYCDPIIEQIKGSFCILEDYYLNGHLKPVKTKNIYYADFLAAIGFLLNSFLNVLKKDTISIDKKCSELVCEITSRFGVTIFLNNTLRRQVIAFYSMKLLYSYLFEFIKPKCILVLVGYGNEAKIYAAKKKGIPVIEMQHGTLSPYHVGYHFPEGTKKRYFADYFFTFGDFWKNAANFPIPEKNIISIGYPYLADALEKFKDVKKKKRIVFISQGSIGGFLSRFAVQLRKIVPEQIDIIYKLHPGEYDRWKQEYPCLIDSDITVIDSYSPDLYELLSSSVWQIGVYSTAIYEGLAFGCVTYLVDLPGVAYMDKLIESGYAQLVATPEEVDLDFEKVAVDKQYFFAGEWKDNFKNAISEILRIREMNYASHVGS